jgi:CDP-diacylglycerol pyrophosphatase
MAYATTASLQSLYNLPNGFGFHLHRSHLRYLVRQSLAAGCFRSTRRWDSLAGGLQGVLLRRDPTTSYLRLGGDLGAYRILESQEPELATRSPIS